MTAYEQIAAELQPLNPTDRAVLLDALLKLGEAILRERQMRETVEPETCPRCRCLQDAADEIRMRTRAASLLLETVVGSATPSGGGEEGT